MVETEEVIPTKTLTQAERFAGHQEGSAPGRLLAVAGVGGGFDENAVLELVGGVVFVEPPDGVFVEDGVFGDEQNTRGAEQVARETHSGAELGNEDFADAGGPALGLCCLEEQANGVRAERFAAFFEDLFERAGFRGSGFDKIRHNRQHPSGRGNKITREPIGIALAVDALVL